MFNPTFWYKFCYSKLSWWREENVHSLWNVNFENNLQMKIVSEKQTQYLTVLTFHYAKLYYVQGKYHCITLLCLSNTTFFSGKTSFYFEYSLILNRNKSLHVLSRTCNVRSGRFLSQKKQKQTKSYLGLHLKWYFQIKFNRTNLSWWIRSEIIKYSTIRSIVLPSFPSAIPCKS